MNFAMIAFLYIVSSLDKLGRLLLAGAVVLLAYLGYQVAGPLAAATVLGFGCLLWWGRLK